MVVFGAFGTFLSWTWCISVNSYLQLNSRKYETLKDLESKLEYQFFKNEWEYLGTDKKKQTYRQLSVSELFTPIIFFIFFLGFSIFGLYKLKEDNFFHFLIGLSVFEIFLLVYFFYYIQRNKQISEERQNGLIE